MAAPSVAGRISAATADRLLGVPATAWPARTRAAFAAVAGLAASLMGVKVLALAASRYRFGRSVGWADVAQGLAVEVTIVAAFFLAAVVARAVEPVGTGGGWRGVARGCCATLQLLLAAAAAAAAVFSLMCAYVFWEWGAFLDRDQLEMVFRSPSPDSLRWYLTRPAGAALAVALVAASALAAAAHVRLRRRVPSSGATLLAAVGLASAWGPAASGAARPWRHDPGAASPILLALTFRDPETTADLGGYPLPPATEFRYDPARPIAPEWEPLRGAARGRDLILLSLESTRRSNVQLYGYRRPTTPNLTRMAANALVFQRAYVSQPRSSKALESLVYGVYPDPRLEPLSWNIERLVGKPNLLATLQRNGYGLYFGVGGRREWDGFYPLLRTAATFDRAAGTAELQRKYGPLPAPDLSLDTAVVQDFLEWYGSRPGPAAALLWFAGGHHPYRAPVRIFTERSDVDRYDNSLRSADEALGRLLAGLRQLGRRPLVLVFGDHGEAFGEHLGDVLHGTYLYDESVRVPFVLWDPELFPRGRELEARFTLKDVPATLLFLLGEDERLWQSEVIFSREAGDKVYLSTVMGDHKLGMVAGDEKFMFRPQRGLSYLFDLEHDEEERHNLVPSRPREQIQARQRELLAWYAYQTDWLERNFPRPRR